MLGYKQVTTALSDCCTDQSRFCTDLIMIRISLDRRSILDRSHHCPARRPRRHKNTVNKAVLMVGIENVFTYKYMKASN